jgi:hypothetical protein
MLKKILIIGLIFNSFFELKAQSDLTSHTDFFQNKTSEIQEWLNINNLANILNLNNIEVQKEKVYVGFAIKDKHNWQRLDSVLLETQNCSLSKMLFKKTAFILNLEYKQCKLEIEAMDFFIYIDYENEEIKTSFQQKMGEISDNSNIVITGIAKLTFEQTYESNFTILEIKGKINQALTKHYKTFKNLYSDYSINVAEEDNSLIYNIADIKGAILEGECFERITIEFEFVNQNDQVLVYFSFEAKCGNNVFDDYNSNYKDISIKNKEAMNNYWQKLQEIIKNAI